MNVSANFIGEAAINLTRCPGRAMLYSGMAKGALRLKLWAVSCFFKSRYLMGEILFGKKLETAISGVTGGKSVLLP